MGKAKNGQDKRRIPWNKGRKDPRAGTPESPWKATSTSGAGNNQGRRPGDQNKSTKETGFRIEEFRRKLVAKLDPDVFASIVAKATLEGSAPHAKLYADYVIGRPKQAVEIDPGAATIGEGGFRCFLGDGRPIPAASIPQSGKTPPSS